MRLQRDTLSDGLRKFPAVFLSLGSPRPHLHSLRSGYERRDLGHGQGQLSLA